MMTNKEIQQTVNRMSQQHIDRMRATFKRAQAEIQEQIEECERQAELCRKRLMELDK